MKPYVFGDVQVKSGTKKHTAIQPAKLPSGEQVDIDVLIVHGVRPGPTVWLSGLIHGDEISGLEIVRNVVDAVNPKQMAGTILAVPIVNTFAFLYQTRYLPDRRDLNRSFPGSKRGSLASRLAAVMVEEIVKRADVGIDFHSGSDDRCNLPHIRANTKDPQTRELAEVFAAPVTIYATAREKSLRRSALDLGKKILVFEGGEAHRFDANAIAAGRDGTLRVLAALGMTDVAPDAKASTRHSYESRWVRASRSGVMRDMVRLGDLVEKGQILGKIGPPIGGRQRRLRAPCSGIVIGISQNPVVHQGDAVLHIAKLSK